MPFCGSSLQKGRKSSADRLVFTVNLGTFSPRLASALGWPVRDTDILNGHWKARLGELLPAPADRWWTVASQAEASALVGHEVAGLLRLYGLPALREAGSIPGLTRYFESGVGVMYAGAPGRKSFPL